MATTGEVSAEPRPRESLGLSPAGEGLSTRDRHLDTMPDPRASEEQP